MTPADRQQECFRRPGDIFSIVPPAPCLPIMVLNAGSTRTTCNTRAKYQSRKTELFEAIWNVWGWDGIGLRFRRAS
jgi:hypothetical protein